MQTATPSKRQLVLDFIAKHEGCSSSEIVAAHAELLQTREAIHKNLSSLTSSKRVVAHPVGNTRLFYTAAHYRDAIRPLIDKAAVDELATKQPTSSAHPMEDSAATAPAEQPKVVEAASPTEIGFTPEPTDPVANDALVDQLATQVASKASGLIQQHMGGVLEAFAATLSEYLVERTMADVAVRMSQHITDLQKSLNRDIHEHLQLVKSNLLEVALLRQQIETMDEDTPSIVKQGKPDYTPKHSKDSRLKIAVVGMLKHQRVYIDVEFENLFDVVHIEANDNAHRVRTQLKNVAHAFIWTDFVSHSTTELVRQCCKFTFVKGGVSSIKTALEEYYSSI